MSKRVVNPRYFQVLLSPEYFQKLDIICQTYSLNRSSLVRSWIDLEYEKIAGQPGIKEALQALEECAKKLSDLGYDFKR